jgi:hypothetical protein
MSYAGYEDALEVNTTLADIQSGIETAMNPLSELLDEQVELWDLVRWRCGSELAFPESVPNIECSDYLLDLFKNALTLNVSRAKETFDKLKYGLDSRLVIDSQVLPKRRAPEFGTELRYTVTSVGTNKSIVSFSPP